MMDNWVWHKTIFKDGIHFLHWMFLFNIHVTASVWICTLLLLQEVSLVDAVVLKAAIVLGDSPWLGPQSMLLPRVNNEKTATAR